MSKGIVVIKEGKRPTPGKIESIVTVSSVFKISENEILSLIESGSPFEFEGDTYYFDEALND
jgi:hypothetical protein